MRLPGDPDLLSQMTKRFGRTICTIFIKERRCGIRLHRDQKGDDRCWLDDYRVWRFLRESPCVPTRVPNDAGKKCWEFYTYRRASRPDGVPRDAICDPALWDSDLVSMHREALVAELLRIQAAIRVHRDASEPRAIWNDRQLYAVLPENIPADFRLPSEAAFLGRAHAPCAGCPSFWESHARCSAPHDFHRWGPCT
jgi:hypothetical protein